MTPPMPIAEATLRQAMRDPRYWRSWHPEQADFVGWVTDIAVADDSSGIFGNDDGVIKYGDDTDRDIAFERVHMDNESLFKPRRQLWSLEHFKIGHFNSWTVEDMGQTLVGLYTSRAKVSEAIARLSVQPGFRDWPDGFRVGRQGLNRVGWECGFVSWEEA